MIEAVTFIGGPEAGTIRRLETNVGYFRFAEPTQVPCLVSDRSRWPDNETCRIYTYIIRRVGRNAWAAVLEELS